MRVAKKLTIVTGGSRSRGLTARRSRSDRRWCFAPERRETHAPSPRVATRQPEVRREFDRSDRLFVRFPVYGGPEITVAAKLLNRQGKELRTLTVAPLKDGVYQLDVPLSVSLRDDYLVAIDATRGTDTARALVPFRVR